MFFRQRNGRNELSAPAALDDLLRRLPRLVQLPVSARIIVRRIEYRLFEELIAQINALLLHADHIETAFSGIESPLSYALLENSVLEK